jgi:hypothetical protein
MDGAYQSKYIAIARMLWDASKGDPGSIPDSYCEHLSHKYVDGSVSLVTLLNKFEVDGELEDYEFEEAIEILGKVNPEDWPFEEDVLSVDVQHLLSGEAPGAKGVEDFVEDNLGTSEKVEKVLKAVIESVFGDAVSEVRSKGGSFPNEDNKFLQESDGTFVGKFKSGEYEFEFQIAPTESGWLCTYRLTESSLDKIPDSASKVKSEVTSTSRKERRLRFRGW